MKSIKYLKENNIDVDSSIELFGDVDFYNSTMQDFLDNIDNKLEKLKLFKDQNDIGNYAIFAHSVKSDARYLGFTHTAQVALEHEMAGKEDNAKFINDNYESFLVTISEMITIVKKYLFEEDEENSKPVLTATPSINSKKTILVMDDSPLITNLITKAIGELYNLVVYNDSSTIIDYINQNHNTIDIMLLDLNIPGINGFQILEHLRVNNLFDSIKVSIITGDESKETIDNAFFYPIIDMLSKPFSVDNLNNVVDKTLNTITQ